MFKEEMEKLMKIKKFFVEVHYPREKFPFKLFKQEPFEDSRSCPDESKDSWANFAFDTKEEALEFTNFSITKKALGLTCRVFQNKLNVTFEETML